jgi:ribonucleotide monophosphatase NagD (HAD superfamily)
MANHGAVRLMGKPDRIIYDRVLEMTGLEDTPEEAIAVGDSLEHDVAGANEAGVESVFVCGGIHAKELGMRRVASAAEVGDGSGVAPPDREKVLEAAEDHDCEPDYAVPVFVW